MSSTSNPFDSFEVANRYEDWYAGRGRRADLLEKRLLTKLLSKFPHASSVLDFGCGTGHFTRWLADKGFQPVGLDISPAMLAEARKRNNIEYVHGTAEALPFPDRGFDLTTLITTLEFIEDPQRALSEAVRVAAQGIILGVLNRKSVLGMRRKRSGKPPWNTARFYSPSELKQLVEAAAGKRCQS